MDEKQLKSRARVVRVFVERTFIFLAGSLLTTTASGIAFATAFEMFFNPASDRFIWMMSLVFMVMGLGFLGLTVLCFYVVWTDPLFVYLRASDEYEIVEGTLNHVDYIHTGDRGRGYMRVRGYAKNSKGQKVSLLEDFRRGGWSYANRDSGKNLKPGDDWYSAKGKRETLPIKVYAAVRRKGATVGALIGIPKIPG
jgi:hypothetical protein